MIDEKVLKRTLEDLAGNMEEIKSLNEVITSFIDDIHTIATDKNNDWLENSAYRTVFLANIIDEKAKFVQSEIEKLIPCQQST